MPELRLGEPELSQALVRAQEIAAAGPTESPLEQRFAAYLQATDELGLPREAVVQALKEQLGLSDLQLEPGARVFAPSADGYLYAATVQTVEKSGVRVSFDAGGEHLCDYTDLRPFALSPGTIVEGCWREDDTWYGARIRQYDAEKKKATVVYRLDGTVEKLTLDRIRIEREVPATERRSLVWAAAPLVDLVLKLGAGGILGFLLARLLGG